jgi:CheY-like chemotaxis protein
VLLLVEDNAAHAYIIRRCFEESHMPGQMYHVTNGEAAPDYLAQRGAYADPLTAPRPHVILLDLRLPKIDGLEVLRYIKSSDVLRPIPVVVLTTSEAEVDMVRAANLDATSYVVKPLETPQFTELMRSICRYWLARNRSLSP